MSAWPRFRDPWPGMSGLSVTPALADQLPVLVDALSGRERRCTVDALIEAMLSRIGGSETGGTTLNGTTHTTTEVELTGSSVPAGLLSGVGRAIDYTFAGLYTWNGSATVNLRARWDDGTSTTNLGTFTAQGFGTTGTSQMVVMRGRMVCSLAGTSGRLVSAHDTLTRARVGEVTGPTTYTTHDLDAAGRLEITGQLSAGGALPNTFAPLLLMWQRTR